MTRKPGAWAVLAVAVYVLIITCTPTAFAQRDPAGSPLDHTGSWNSQDSEDSEDSTGDLLGAIEEGVGDSVDEVTVPVEHETERLEGELTDSVDDVTDPVDDVTDSVDDVTDSVDDETEPLEGELTDPVDEVIDTVDETIGGENGPAGDGDSNQASDTLTEPVDETVDKLTGTASEPTGAIGDGTVGLMIGSEETGHSSAQQASDPDSKTRRSLRADATQESDAGSGVRADSGLRDPRSPDRGSAGAAPEHGSRHLDAIQMIGRVFGEATEQAAFPLVLTVLVIGFLMVQNHIDRRDPKLAMAPVDSKQEHLNFI